MGSYGLMLVLALALVALTACSNPSGSDRQGAPRLTFDRQLIDFGDMKEGTEVKVLFTLRNEGGKPLVIERAITRVVQGCCPVQPALSNKSISPGKQGTLALNFTMGEGMGGYHVFQVVVSSNDPAQPEAILEVRANFVAP
ncbi:MAG: DUF1573 domain-containing protein [Chloroflexi bacterium]|nr:DUF1573 domain-containing protein [Chloroflexota bacterium]